MKTALKLFLPADGNRAVLAGVCVALGLSAAACSEDQATTPTANRAPTAVVASDLTEILEGDANSTIVSISGANSTDPDGDALTYLWSIPGGTFENGTNTTDTNVSVTFPGNTIELVTLTVMDTGGLSDAAELTIGLRPGPNQAPVAAFTVSPATVPLGDGNVTVVTLDASGSLDPDGDAISFAWTAPGATFVGGTGPNGEVAQVTIPGTLPVAVTLIVTDEAGLTDAAASVIQLS